MEQGSGRCVERVEVAAGQARAVRVRARANVRVVEIVAPATGAR